MHLTNNNNFINMSRIEKLAIRGIRSFDPQDEVKIEFFRPLTLIQGHNGSGKTTIIECLKMATCGSLPPLATNGKTFICDPKITGNNEVKSSIKLKFLTPRDKEVIIIRNFQLAIKSNKYEFKRLEQILKSSNSNGELVTINSTCIDIDKQVPLLMHASKAILENVIFCHQEEINWPFSEAGNLKKVFDEIFDTAKYTKALEDLKDTNKEYQSKSKELKNKIELIQKDFEQFHKINLQIESTTGKINELTSTVTELEENLQKTEKDYKQILEYEEKLRKKESEISMAKMKLEEKMKQVENIKSDPMFENYTENDEVYENYCKNCMDHYSEYQSEHSESVNLAKNMEIFTFQVKSLTDEINMIDANILSKTQFYQNFINHKKEIIENLNSSDGLDMKFSSNSSSDNILKALQEKEIEIKTKISMMDEKKKTFESKLIEKLNEKEVNKCLYESKVKEIESLMNKKAEIEKIMSNQTSNAKMLSEMNDSLTKKSISIDRLNLDVHKFDVQITEYEKEKAKLNEKIASHTMFRQIKSALKNGNMNMTMTLFHISKLKEYCEMFTRTENTIQETIRSFNKSFNTSFSTVTQHFVISLDEIGKYINLKKEEIIEEKQLIREQNFMLGMHIEVEEGKLNKATEEERSLIKTRDILFNEIKYLFEKFDIPFTSSGGTSSNATSRSMTNMNILSPTKSDISVDISKLLSFQDDLEKIASTLEDERNAKFIESKYLEEYLRNLNQEGECTLCTKPATKSEIAIISKTLNSQINIIKEKVKTLAAKIEEKKKAIDEIKKMDFILNKLQTIIEDLNKKVREKADIEAEAKILYDKRKKFENSSKEKTNQIMNIDKLFLNAGRSNTNSSGLKEEIYGLKNEILDIEKNIEQTCDVLNITGHSLKSSGIGLNINIGYLISYCNDMLLAANEYNSIENDQMIINNKITESSQQKSALLETLNKINSEIRQIENEKIRLSAYCDENEMSTKIHEIEMDIVEREKEKQVLSIESEKINDLKSALISKKIEFDKLYNEKYSKYKSLLDKISNLRIIIECVNKDFERIIGANVSEIPLERIFEEQTLSLKSEREGKEIRRKLIEVEISKLSEELYLYENEKKKNLMRENIYKNNLLLYSINREIQELVAYLNSNENRIQVNNKIGEAKERISEKKNLFMSQYHLNLGKIQELQLYLNKLNTEKKNDIYNEIEKRYSKLKMEYILAIETSKQIESYYEALDQSLLKYHGKRMEEINKLINYYWNMTYKGNDIRWIEIRSDYEKTSRSRSYNYRIVYGTNEDYELDMRGRCSAGQKVLASIIIRLALAETFCNSCGILCLDEPTTNLDEDHVRSLAKSLREIIHSRSDDQNFQLIIITHDPTFVDLIGSDFCDSFWYVAKNSQNFSKLELKPISSIFNS